VPEGPGDSYDVPVDQAVRVYGVVLGNSFSIRQCFARLQRDMIRYKPVPR
jgi:hypothetical protein